MPWPIFIFGTCTDIRVLKTIITLYTFPKRTVIYESLPSQHSVNSFRKAPKSLKIEQQFEAEAAQPLNALANNQSGSLKEDEQPHKNPRGQS